MISRSRRGIEDHGSLEEVRSEIGSASGDTTARFRRRRTPRERVLQQESREVGILVYARWKSNKWHEILVCGSRSGWELIGENRRAVERR